MHIAAGKFIYGSGRKKRKVDRESLEERAREETSAKGERGRKGKKGEDARTGKGQKKRTVSLSFSSPFLSPRGWRKLCDR